MQQTSPVFSQIIIPLLAIVLSGTSLSGCTATPQSNASTPQPISKLLFLHKQPENNAAPSEVANAPTCVTLDQHQEKEIGLRLDTARHGFVFRTVEAPGRVQPNAELSTLISTPSPGRVVEVKAKLGDAIKPGQVMAVIKSDAIGQVQSDLLQNTLQAKADIKQQQVQLKLSHITFERESLLYKEQVSAQADLQTAQNQLEKDEANLSALKAKLDATIRVAQERLSLLGAPPDSAQKVVNLGRIDPWVFVRAPRAGLVIDRSVNPGEMTDGSKPLFTLANLSEVWLVADVFEKDVHSVGKGQEASVSLDSLPGHPFPAKIVWVGDSINATTRTMPVRANVANPETLLKPGMFARIKIAAGKDPVVLVPRSATIQLGDKVLVFRPKGKGVFEEHEVQTGENDENDIEIRSGLKPGDAIVSNGAVALMGTAMKAREGSD